MLKNEAPFILLTNRDYLIPVIFKDDEGNALDLTDSTIYFTIKELDDSANDDDTAVLKLTNTEHTDAINGETTFVFDKDDTNAIAPGTYVWDITVVLENGSTSSSRTGTLLFERPVTQTIE